MSTNQIITIISALIGAGGIIFGIVKFVITRKDQKNRNLKNELTIIISELSSFRSALHTALLGYYKLIGNLNQIYSEKISCMDNHISNLERFRSEKERLLKKHCSSFCELAPSCPDRIDVEEPNDFTKLFEQISTEQNEYAEKEFLINSKIQNLLNGVTSSLNNYSDFVSHIPQLHSLPINISNNFLKDIMHIEDAVHNLQGQILNIKKNTFSISKEDDIGRTIIEIIGSIDMASFKISKIINNL